jgi:hypothetical protein
MLPQVDRHHVGDEDLGKAVTPRRGLVFLGDVARERSLSACKVAFAAACANLVVSVADDPDGVASGPLSEIEAGSFGAARHRSIIPLRSDSVTKDLPAMRVMRNRPRRASVRNESAVSAGLMRAAASFSVSRRMSLICHHPSAAC